MPIYEYECVSCSAVFEDLIRHSDPDPDCPECGEVEVRRLISNTSFQLKGSGWYVTDYKKPESSKGKGSETSQSEGSKTGDGSDSKHSDSEPSVSKASTKTSKAGDSSAGNTASAA